MRTRMIEDSELEAAMQKASENKSEFLRLRNRAVLATLRLTGKRRGEIAMIPLQNITVDHSHEHLNMTFILEKKRRGNVLQKLSTKTIPLTDPLTKPILEYLDYLNGLTLRPQFFLPRIKSVFGCNTMIPNAHISGRQVFNIVRDASQTLWPHLFRESVAADIVNQDNSIIAAFKVQQRLDLENYQTGFNYLRRFASDVIQREIKQLEAKPD